ncbi:MAG: N-formylglutamate amidohydrolase [Pelagibacterales bacterium]|nr:N-formylglutamate amidohydrolase [Pelagibacterales bacterium]
MIIRNINNSLPIIISIPHSGTNYSRDFLKNILLSKKELEYSEDNYVDKILDKTLNNNFSFIKAKLPRSFIDVNRHPLEIDPLMLSSPIPKFSEVNSKKSRNGIGVIHRVSCNGNEIYDRLLTRREVIKRLLSHYFPYHKSLKMLIKKTKKNYKDILVLDFHSMPSNFLDNNIDIVLGNNYNLSSNKIFSSKIIKYFNINQYSLSINNPYSGGYITKYYGNPIDGVNVLQIEINRSLYMNEKTLNLLDKKMNLSSNNLCIIIKNLCKELIKYNKI